MQTFLQEGGPVPCWRYVVLSWMNCCTTGTLGALPAWWPPWTASTEKLEELWTMFPKCTTSFCLHSFSASLLSLQHPYTPGVNSQAPLTPPSLSYRKGTTTSVQGSRTDRRNKCVKCLLPSREKGFNRSLLHRTSWLPSQQSQQSFASPSQTQRGWVSLTGRVRWRVTPAGQAGSQEGKPPCWARAHSVRWHPATVHTVGILPSQSS